MVFAPGTPAPCCFTKCLGGGRGRRVRLGRKGLHLTACLPVLKLLSVRETQESASVRRLRPSPVPPHLSPNNLQLSSRRCSSAWFLHIPSKLMHRENWDLRQQQKTPTWAGGWRGGAKSSGLRATLVGISFAATRRSAEVAK